MSVPTSLLLCQLSKRAGNSGTNLSSLVNNVRAENVFDTLLLHGTSLVKDVLIYEQRASRPRWDYQCGWLVFNITEKPTEDPVVCNPEACYTTGKVIVEIEHE